jgi:hypothetical protein
MPEGPSPRRERHSEHTTGGARARSRGHAEETAASTVRKAFGH